MIAKKKLNGIIVKLMVMESKICGKCQLSLPTNQFAYFFEKHRNKWRYASYCRSCQKQNAKKHYEDNRENIRQ